MVMLPLLKQTQTLPIKHNPRLTQPSCQHLKQLLNGAPKMEIITLKELFQCSNKGGLIHIRQILGKAKLLVFS
uniref:Uncharacterized protein n=1 Tax=Rhizophora mucronata TaxID=61149 RepID=A0A2P2M573_RHIMU